MSNDNKETTMATLTPPADAPLPWTAWSVTDAVRIRDADGNPVIPSFTILRYLVAAANAAPGLVAERDSLLADRETLRTLAANLAVAGALWAAHSGIDDTDCGGKWWPGMGRAAPGWER